MMPVRFKELLVALGWNPHGLSVILDTHDTIVRRWASGETVIPANVAAWLEARARIAFKRPLPSGWKTRSEKPHEGSNHDA